MKKSFNILIFLIMIITLLFFLGCTSTESNSIIPNTTINNQNNTNANVVKESASNEGIICKDIAYINDKGYDKNVENTTEICGKALDDLFYYRKLEILDFEGCENLPEKNMVDTYYFVTYKNTTNVSQMVSVRFLYGLNFLSESWSSEVELAPNETTTFKLNGIECLPNSAIFEIYGRRGNNISLLAKDSINYNLNTKEQTISKGVYYNSTSNYSTNLMLTKDDCIAKNSNTFVYYDYKNRTNENKKIYLRVIGGPKNMFVSYMDGGVENFLSNGIYRIKGIFDKECFDGPMILEIYSADYDAEKNKYFNYKFLEKIGLNQEVSSNEPTLDKGKYYRNTMDSRRNLIFSKSECDSIEFVNFVRKRTIFYIDYVNTIDSFQKVTAKLKYSSEGELKEREITRDIPNGRPYRFWFESGEIKEIEECIDQADVEFYDEEGKLLRKDTIQ